MNQLRNTVFLFLLFLFLFALSIAVGTRDILVGTDTANYTNYFNHIDYYFDIHRFEPLFKYLTYSVRLLGGNVGIYFLIIFLLFNFSYLYFYFRASGTNKRIEDILILLGLMFFSSWYIVATTNGIRHGLSLPLLYLSLLFFSERKNILSGLYFFASLGFHKTGLLTLPFFPLIYLRSRLIFLVFILSAVLYFLGVTEFLVMTASNILAINLYTDIAEFSSESNKWGGFQANLFVYSVFWGILFYFLQRYVKKEFLENYIRLWKFYCILTMPYFFFGFGAFSNRYAFISWLLLPIIQAYFIVSSRIDSKVKLILGSILFSFGLSSYLFYVFDFSI